MAGRPTKKKADRRTNVLRIRLTEAERGTLQRAAEKTTLDASTWARMTLLGIALSDEGKYRPPSD